MAMIQVPEIGAVSSKLHDINRSEAKLDFNTKKAMAN
jgi:hypothetical protein